jgi:hypothetical protein
MSIFTEFVQILALTVNIEQGHSTIPVTKPWIVTDKNKATDYMKCSSKHTGMNHRCFNYVVIEKVVMLQKC